MRRLIRGVVILAVVAALAVEGYLVAGEVSKKEYVTYTVTVTTTERP